MGDPENEDINTIKNFVLTEKLPNLTEEQIRMFIFFCQNNLQATKDKILSYFSIKKSNPKLFDDWNLDREDIQLQSKTSKFCVFPRKTDDEYIIFFSGLRDLSYRNYEQAPTFKLLIMSVEAAILEHQPKGLIFIFDMEGMSLMHFLKTKLNLQKVFLNYIQDACPVKLKFVHFLNSTYLMHKCIGVIKPFVHRELYESLRFHPSNLKMDDFYANSIPQQFLPRDFGGDLPSIEELHTDNIQKLNNLKEYFHTKEEELKQWNNKLERKGTMERRIREAGL